jgi:hypothetical protein
MDCCYCGSAVDPERIEIGYFHCKSDSCVIRWRGERMRDYSLHLVPKQGFSLVSRGTSVAGRSSGR